MLAQCSPGDCLKMFAAKAGLRVQLCVLLILFLHYCSTGVVEEDVSTWIVPNQRQSILDCRIRYYKYAMQHASGGASYGISAQPREFTQMAAIGWMFPNGTTIWQCGGSLIWENYVLTAAHCAVDSEDGEPNVARFGDLDLFNGDDDENVQQRKIVEIIRHPDHRFSKRYHDIALMRLESRVRFDKTVSPACLWNDDEIRFKKLEATGWGATGFAEKQSPKLLKVSLTPVDLKECRKYYPKTRRLPEGLHANQMCAGDVKMDTCTGDSGGPLEVKLRHNNVYTPFVVGLTSFGAACGQSIPGVYTRVAPYIPWIQSVLIARGENVTEGTFKPQACALRYKHLRNYEGYIQPVNLGKHVSIHWKGSERDKQPKCYGVIIDENTIVTLARCTVVEGIPPAFIRYGDGKTIAVSEYFRHPKYEENSLYNDIGLLKLKDPLVFSKGEYESFFPACLWEGPTPSGQAVNVLVQVLKNFIGNSPGFATTESNETSGAFVAAHAQNGSECSRSSVYASGLAKGLAEEHLCFGIDRYLVPDTCDISLGGPIQSDYTQESSWRIYVFTYVHALNLIGRDCGYGESEVGVNLFHHKEWMESILLPKKVEDDPVAPLVFLHSELEEGERCESSRGNGGICVPTKYCPKELYEFQRGEQVQFCQTVSLVCCPQEYIRNDTDAEWREIDQCENLHATREPSYKFRQNLVSVAWTTKDGEKSCLGTIITSRTIVVAADCVDGIDSSANVSTLSRTTPVSFDFSSGPESPTFSIATGKSKLSVALRRIIIHPEFDRSTKQNNLAMVQLKERLDESLEKTPACLWTNTTHTPFYLTQLERGITLEEFTFAHSRYNADCEGTFGRVLQPQELCVDVTGPLDLSTYLGAPALWKKQVYEESSTPFLVGIASQPAADGSRLFDDRAIIYTRISSYVQWIKSVL